MVPFLCCYGCVVIWRKREERLQTKILRELISVRSEGDFDFLIFNFNFYTTCLYVLTFLCV